ncbi:hypothetical protein ILUMI_18960 [Ignelater luminosus]|uniref:YqaJ viral recombinase domain-containing protein n=1 Tax=Ignelater luminosus TaxID=2038154 RepID=A0A8K0CH13_IGNLU|nr:hypothetical protein ILUMI_18960 [Ignelater luminosus]
MKTQQQSCMKKGKGIQTKVLNKKEGENITQLVDEKQTNTQTTVAVRRSWYGVVRAKMATVTSLDIAEVISLPLINSLIQTSKCGWFIHPSHPFLGTSPDRLINDGKGILEIKCLPSVRENKFKNAKLERACYKIENDCIRLKKS